MAIQSINDYANQALDSTYNASAGKVLDQVAKLAQSPKGRMQKQLAKLDEEAKRLNEEDQRIEYDNAVLEQTLNEYSDLMDTTASLVDANDEAIQQSGVNIAVIAVTAKVFLSLSHSIMAGGGNPITPQAMKFYISQLAARSIDWTNISTLAQIISFVDSPAWIAKMEGWGVGYANLTKDLILHEVEKGAGPIALAQKLREVVEHMPVYASETLTRTLQLTSFRQASLEMELVNGKYIESKIRIARLDDRTCLSCIALHGTPLKKGERVDDHYRGRCTEHYVVPGADPYPTMMQADSTPGNRVYVPFETGEEWFAHLPESRQMAQTSFSKSPGKLRAYQNGTNLSEFIGEHDDSVFGRQVVELSMKGALGDNADQYYIRNAGK
jgi:hypothetical protein